MEQFLATNITELKGIGLKNSNKFSSLGITTIKNLLEHYPRRYEDRSNLKMVCELPLEEYSTFKAKVFKVIQTKPNRKLTITKVIVSDISGNVTLTWFNQPYQKSKFSPGMKIIVSGKIQKKYYGLEINNPDIEPDIEEVLNNRRIFPVYPANEYINQWQIRNLITQTLDKLEILNTEHKLPETLPEDILKNYDLIDRYTAIQNVHFPESTELLNKAKHRLIFEELYLLQCALLYLRKNNKQNSTSIKHSPDGSLIKKLEKSLPFKLTSDQLKAINDVKKDMEDVIPMQRLIQGDVGSGKTIIAAFALAKTVESGYQGALMAPTEILAEQHYQNLSKLFNPHNINLVLLTKSLTTKERRETLEKISDGSADIIIGTHSLIQDKVVFKHLGVVITDEQHRFGVKQRSLLQEKGSSPDVLIMTATPIPRTMALTIYGDLDTSIIKELPPGRKPISTYIRNNEQKGRVYEFAAQEILAGRQVYVVCPLIEESEKLAVKAATNIYEELKKTYFRNINCALIHGKMKQSEKESIMSDFYRGTIKALISTTIIEVGVNVPNATIMVIENAERFGLAQLHQLRGRIGRGIHKSYCILISDNRTEETLERLNTLVESNDGFYLAEKDLITRGPGQFFGTNQHGLPDLKIADIIKDVDVLLLARRAAIDTINSPSALSKIKKTLQNHFADNFKMIFYR